VEEGEMKVVLGVEIELNDADLAALAFIQQRGPTNKKLSHDEVAEFWTFYLKHSIQQARRRNLEYAAMSHEERAAFEKWMFSEVDKEERREKGEQQ
jgi:hypothetical protein